MCHQCFACSKDLKSGPSRDLFYLQKSPASNARIIWADSSWRLILPLLPAGGPGPSSFLASTAAPFDNKSSTICTLPLVTASWSGVSPQALSPAVSCRVAGRRTTKIVGMLSSTGSTDKRRMNVFDTTSINQFVQTKTNSQTHQTCVNT